MQCPIDQTELTMTERQGVEIDYCPKCRGVWLDRGELDKILERSSNFTPSPPESRRTSVASPAGTREVSSGGVFDKFGGSSRDRDDDDYEYDKQGRRKKKRGSFLDDLFDF